MALSNHTAQTITVRPEPGWSCDNFSETGTPAPLDMLQLPPVRARTPARRLEHASWSSYKDNTRLFGLSFYAGDTTPQVMPIDGQPGMGVWVSVPRPLQYGIAPGTAMPTPAQRRQGAFSSTLPDGTPVKITWATAGSASPWQGISMTIAPK